MPGHYLEGAHSAKHPSTLRAVLRSGPFAEGWAVYTENVMADAGYLRQRPAVPPGAAEVLPAQRSSNAILDQGMHVDNWTREQAMELMVDKTFQQEREAAGKWVRAQLTSAQLPTYFVGAQEHFDMRKAVEAQAMATAFNLKAYHDTGAVLRRAAGALRAPADAGRADPVSQRPGRATACPGPALQERLHPRFRATRIIAAAMQVATGTGLRRMHVSQSRLTSLLQRLRINRTPCASAVAAEVAPTKQATRVRAQNRLPSTCTTLSVARSTPSRQRTLTAAVGAPSGPTPSLNGAMPQVAQKWWAIFIVLNR